MFNQMGRQPGPLNAGRLKKRGRPLLPFSEGMRMQMLPIEFSFTSRGAILFTLEHLHFN